MGMPNRSKIISFIQHVDNYGIIDFNIFSLIPFAAVSRFVGEGKLKTNAAGASCYVDSGERQQISFLSEDAGWA